MKKEYFDNIISLGYNCQTAFVFQAMYYGKNQPPSNFFNWVYCPSVQDIINFLQNPDILFQKGLELHLPSYMYIDVSSKFYYHTLSKHEKFHKNGKLDSELNQEFIENDKKDVISRMSHLREKFINTLNNNEKNLFVLTYPCHEAKENIIDNVTLLSKFFAENSKNSKILIVFRKKYVKNIKLPPFDNVIYRYLGRLADQSHADKSDFFGWYFNVLKNIEIKNAPPKSIFNIIKFKK